jgi:hypothetical protein
MADNIADFMCGESRIDRDAEIVEPKLYFTIACPDVNMRRLAAFV